MDYLREVNLTTLIIGTIGIKATGNRHHVVLGILYRPKNDNLLQYVPSKNAIS